MINYISSNYFARMANVVFAEDITKSQFSKHVHKKIKITENSERIKYINLNFQLKDNDIIFCQTEHIRFLFRVLKNSKVKNLVLITSQSDLEIDYSLVKKLPSCFKKWFCINASIVHPKLVTIPLGIANDYEKNLTISELNGVTLDYFKKKKYLLYVNFNVNTNRNKRSHLYGLFQNKNNNILLTKHDSKKSNYKENILNSNFVLCPEGNGIDTHRIWETLYLGSIPIVERRPAYDYIDALPVLTVDSFESISNELLYKYLKDSNNNFNLEFLDFTYWKNMITKEVENLEIKNKITINISKTCITTYMLILKLRTILNKLRKYFLLYYWKIKKYL